MARTHDNNEMGVIPVSIAFFLALAFLIAVVRKHDEISGYSGEIEGVTYGARE